MIVLLAQILFCLVAAPVIGAQPWVIPPAQPADGRPEAPTQPRAVIQAAFDASNVRPEEVSDAEQKKGNVRGGVRSGFRTSIVTPHGPAASSVGSAGFVGSALRTTFLGVQASVRGADPARIAHGYLEIPATVCDTGVSPVLTASSSIDAADLNAVLESCCLEHGPDAHVTNGFHAASRKDSPARELTADWPDAATTAFINTNVPLDTGWMPVLLTLPTCKSLHETAPAIQPTGPPASR
jgi:hypothetical protein